jgi:hypothetical protein
MMCSGSSRRWVMESLRSFLEEKAKEFQRAKRWRKESLRRALEAGNEEDALHVPEDSNPETIAEVLIQMADKSPLGYSGLEEWAANLTPEYRQEVSLYEIAEMLNPNY